jgi:hypothetical protein
MQRKEYLDYRAQVLQNASDQIGKYDRALLYLSSGAIGLSLTFTDSISSQDPPTSACFLAGAWALFLLSLVAIVGSQFSGFKAAQFDLRQVDQLYSTSKYEWQRNPWNLWVELGNATSGIFFCLGAIALVLFAYLNIGR